MNQLVQGVLTKFARDQELAQMSPEHAFERLAAWCVMAGALPGGASVEDLMAGDATVGVDALAIVANDGLVADTQDAEDVCTGGRAVDVDFTFVQAKTSESFERSQILSFGDAVAAFFESDASVVESSFVTERREAKDRLYQDSHLFRNRSPILRLAYVTTGQPPSGDLNISGAVTSVKKKLDSMSLFDRVEVELLGAAEVHRSYAKIEHREEATFNFARKTTIPKIEGVKEAYIGVVAATEFMKLISDDDTGAIKTSVFYDNVRGFQDMNTVNSGILETLQSPADAILFPVLNNGITVVAQEVRVVGEDVTVEDYQIVNGCQTSYVLHAGREHLTPEVLVPLRLVVTERDSVASQITKATNRQTPVEEVNLQALTDFQKELEAYFEGQVEKRRLYYERRSKQYAGLDVEQTRVISPLVQMRAFAACFLDEPHTASRYYRQLSDRVPTDIFSSTHRHEPYYTSALAWYRLDVAYRRKLLRSELRPVRYHMLMVIKFLANDSAAPPALSSPKIRPYCETLNGVLVDEQGSIELFKKAGDLLIDVGGTAITRDMAKRERFTKQLLERF